MSRWIRFFVVFALSLAGGLFYGWRVDPVEYINTAPDSLHPDYKADYVLMVAEAYLEEQDLTLAVRRLAILGDQSPAEIVARATLHAADRGWSSHLLAQMQALADALQSIQPVLGAPTP